MTQGRVWQKLMRFAVIGGAGTLVHTGVALLLHYQAGVAALTANALAFCSAWAVSYIGNWAWTFDAVSEHQTAVPRYLTISLSCFALNQTLLWLTYSHWDWPMWLALAPSVVAVPIASFAASYLWAFAAPPTFRQAES